MLLGATCGLSIENGENEVFLHRNETKSRLLRIIIDTCVNTY